MDKIQKSTATLFNRYREVFLALRDAVRSIHGNDLGGADLRILSFGCSTGAEMLTARAYFPDATLFGCDVDRGALNMAAANLVDDAGEVFLSSPEAIRAFAPYDIILANSVFCFYPLPQGVSDLKKHFPFSRFEDLASLLIESLSDEGVFMLYNSNYRFFDLEKASGFKSLLAPQIEANGFVDKFARNGEQLTRSTQYQGQRTYVHRVLNDAIVEEDLRDCLFHRNSGLEPRMSTLPSASKAARPILGLDPDRLEIGEIAAGLFEEHLEDEGIRRLEWRKSSLNGSVRSFGSWDITAHHPRLRSDYFIEKGAQPPKTSRLKRWFS